MSDKELQRSTELVSAFQLIKDIDLDSSRDLLLRVYCFFHGTCFADGTGPELGLACRKRIVLFVMADAGSAENFICEVVPENG